MLKKIIFFLFCMKIGILALKTNGLCVECGSCRYFYHGYKCKMFAEDKTIDNTIIYNYKLLKENNTFIYLNILQARSNDKLCGKRGHFFRPIIYKTHLKE